MNFNEPHVMADGVPGLVAKMQTLTSEKLENTRTSSLGCVTESEKYTALNIQGRGKCIMS